ncbi:MAG: sterol desaturase family protein [Spirosomataceae bacterium]
MEPFQNLDVFDRFSLTFLLQLLRYVLLAGGAYLLFYHLKKSVWFYRKIQPKFPKHKDIYREIGYSVLTMLIFAAMGIGIFFLRKLGWTQIYTQVGERGWGYLLFSVVLAVFGHDTYFYWTHRLMHHPKLFPYFHKVHHLSHNPTPWAAFAFHPLEAVVEAGVLVFMVFLFPLHPLAILVFLLFMTVMNVLGHTGYEVYPPWFLKTWWGRWQNTSTHHNMHHQWGKGNYGLYFNIWDKLMKTNFRHYEATFEANASRVKTAKKEAMPQKR